MQHGLSRHRCSVVLASAFSVGVVLILQAPASNHSLYDTISLPAWETQLNESSRNLSRSVLGAAGRTRTANEALRACILSQTPAKATFHARDDPRSTCVGWPWLLRASRQWANTSIQEILWRADVEGGEVHMESAQVLASVEANGSLLHLLRAVVPEPQRCQCVLRRWDQYAVCESAFAAATRAMSFGIRHSDPWALHVAHQYKIRPQLFDCFDLQRPEGFDFDFSETCLTGYPKANNDSRFETLPRFFKDLGNASVLLKMDIEGSEDDVIDALDSPQFDRIVSINVEVHMRCTPGDVQRKIRGLEKLRRNMVLVDGAVVYFGKRCLVEGMPVPKLLALSYVAPRVCD